MTAHAIATRLAQKHGHEKERWPGGVHPNGEPIQNAENTKAVEERRVARQEARKEKSK